MKNLKGRATMAALGLVPVVVLATAGTVTASGGVDPLYADGHKHASYADWSGTVAKAPATRGARPDILDAKGRPVPLATLRKNTPAPARGNPLTPIPTITAKAKPLADSGGSTRTGAALATGPWVHSCNTVPGRSAAPPPPASGLNFGVARAARNPISGTWQGWMQNAISLPGLGSAGETPVAWVAYGVFARNVDIPGLTVKVSALPKWHGAMELNSQGFNLAFSEVTGRFRASHGWFNETLNRWDSIGEIRTQTRTAVNGSLAYYAFDKGAGTGTFSIGDNLPKGQTVDYDMAFETQASVQTQPAAPGAAHVDFGSAGLDTPASMIDRVTGQPLRGYWDAGTRAIDGAFKIVFTSTVRDFTITCG